MTGNRLEAVIGAARSILDNDSFEDSAQTIFNLCKELTGAQAGYVALLSDDGHENEVLFLDSGGLECTVDENLPMPIRGLRGVAYSTQEAVYENDFMKSDWVRFLPEGHIPMKNVIFAPLNIDGATVGIMGLANKPVDFTDDDAFTVTVFGELAAVALKNSYNIERLNKRTKELEQALEEVHTLHGFLPICMKCKKIRDVNGFWSELETYFAKHTDVDFSHGYCDECAAEVMKEIED